jgi:hypothetical protein
MAGSELMLGNCLINGRSPGANLLCHQVVGSFKPIVDLLHDLNYRIKICVVTRNCFSCIVLRIDYCFAYVNQYRDQLIYLACDLQAQHFCFVVDLKGLACDYFSASRIICLPSLLEPPQCFVLYIISSWVGSCDRADAGNNCIAVTFISIYAKIVSDFVDILLIFYQVSHSHLYKWNVQRSDLLGEIEQAGSCDGGRGPSTRRTYPFSRAVQITRIAKGGAHTQQRQEQPACHSSYEGAKGETCTVPSRHPRSQFPHPPHAARTMP